MRIIIALMIVVLGMTSCKKEDITVSEDYWIVLSKVDGLSVKGFDNKGNETILHTLNRGMKSEMSKNEYYTISVLCPDFGCHFEYNGNQYYSTTSFDRND